MIAMSVTPVKSTNKKCWSNGCITELPLLPEFEYVFTCKKCGTHVYSVIEMCGYMPPFCTQIMLCSICAHVHEVI